MLDVMTWWRHQMETLSVLLALCAGNSQATGEFPSQRPVTRSFDVFFDLRLNKRLRKQSWGWCLRRHYAHYDVIVLCLTRRIYSPNLKSCHVKTPKQTMHSMRFRHLFFINKWDIVGNIYNRKHTDTPQFHTYLWDVTRTDCVQEILANERKAWCRHQIETFSALLNLCTGNSPVPCESPSQRPVTRSFDLFFDRRLKKLLSKHSIRWWFETPARPLWRNCNSNKHILLY